MSRTNPAASAVKLIPTQVRMLWSLDKCYEMWVWHNNRTACVLIRLGMVEAVEDRSALMRIIPTPAGRAWLKENGYD